MNDSLILASLQKQIEELHRRLAELTNKQTKVSQLAFSNADALSKIIPSINVLDIRTFELHDRDVSINRRLNRVFRAHNRHVLSTVEPRKQAPGWARNKARDQRTWAKPKGWRL